MKQYYLSFFICLCYISALAQIDTSGTVKFSDSAIDKKLVFIELQPSYYKNPDVKNLTRYSPLAEKETAIFLSQNFNCFRYFLASNSLTGFLFKNYRPKIFPTYYVFDTDSNFLYSDFGVNKTVEDFVSMRDSALKKEEALNKLKLYQDKFDKNSIAKEELKDFIELKLYLKRYDNGQLIEKFASEMTEEDTNNPQLLLLIMRAGPLYRSLASKKAVTNRKLYNTIYRKEYYNFLPYFNQRALKNTTDYAAKTKDLEMIQDVAKSYQYRYNRNEYAKEAYSPLIMMNYYKSIKDTINYLNYLCKYYDKHLLITPDSAKKYEAKLMAKEQKNQVSDSIKSGNVIKTNFKDHFPNGLNYGANQIIKSQTKDPAYLYNGIKYCLHALFLSPNHYKSKATLAHLLYLSGFYNEAEKTMRETIATINIPDSIRQQYVSDLEKMINRNME